MSREPTHNDFKKRWYDDFAVGDSWSFGAHEVTAAEIIAFGQQYDPEPFHRDADEAAASVMGGLIASGIQMAAWYRLMQCQAMTEIAFGMSPGWGNIRFYAPVRPGDVLSGRAEVVAMRTSASRPAMGLVEYKGELFDAAGERKFGCTPVGLHLRKDADTSAERIIP